MNYDFTQQGMNPQGYAVSPETIQPQYISPETIQPQYISPGSIQPQPFLPQYPQYPPFPPFPRPYPPYPPIPRPYPPFPPYQPYPGIPTVGGCNQKWAYVRLRDGRRMTIYVTSISQYSIGGFLPDGRQIALDLDEIVEMTC